MWFIIAWNINVYSGFPSKFPKKSYMTFPWLVAVFTVPLLFPNFPGNYYFPGFPDAVGTLCIINRANHYKVQIVTRILSWSYYGYTAPFVHFQRLETKILSLSHFVGFYILPDTLKPFDWWEVNYNNSSTNVVYHSTVELQLYVSVIFLPCDHKFYESLGNILRVWQEVDID